MQIIHAWLVISMFMIDKMEFSATIVIFEFLGNVLDLVKKNMIR